MVARPAAAVETICFISFISFEMRRGVSRSNLRSSRRSAADDGGGSQLANGRWSLGRSKSLQHTPIAVLKLKERGGEENAPFAFKRHLWCPRRLLLNQRSYLLLHSADSVVFSVILPLN